MPVADTDQLTGLRNRGNFISLLRRQIGQANERKNLVGLVVIDIDGFAQINVANGYDFGDAVLRHMAKQLAQVARGHDYAARIGDNRFALLLPQVLNKGHVELAVQKLQRLLNVPFQSSGSRVMLSFAAGAAVCPEHASEPEFLLRKAETALASARLKGHRYELAEAASHDYELSELWQLEMQLEGAIERGELEMHYQPQVRIGDLHPVGAEALMRWNNPSQGMVSPNIFIPLAERTGQIKKLSIWALNTVLRQSSEWRHDWGRLSVSVNMPGELTIHNDLLELAENAMRLWGKDHVQLVLELTERSLMDRDKGLQMLHQLRKLGVKISIDDFGTGYSCLAYFKNIPADELKIDHSFVSALLTDPGSVDITTLIIDLAHRFELSVVAEGVEDQPTLELLKARGCDIAQGYLYGKAMPSDTFEQWLVAYDPAAPGKTATLAAN